MQEEQPGKLSETIRGRLLTPKSGEFEVAHKVYNEMVDRHPAAIVRCADVADVRAAVNFAREDGLTVKATYQENYERLTKIKRKYDPNNFFHINQNIKPE